LVHICQSTCPHSPRDHSPYIHHCVKTEI
jgi:hypothetical protein